MVVHTSALMEAVAVLGDDHNLRVTITQSGKEALICGACSFIGGIIAGPVGLAVGGTLGGLKAWQMSKGKWMAEAIHGYFNLIMLYIHNFQVNLNLSAPLSSTT